MTTTVTAVWNSASNLVAESLAGGTLLRGRAWDGLFWSGMATSLPFMVDNQPPSLPGDLTVTPQLAGDWSTERVMRVQWSAATDGTGGGVAGYGVVFTNGPWPDAPAFVGAAAGPVYGPPLPDGTDWWVAVRGLDVFGNAGATARSGPYRIDATAPSAAGAVIGVRTSDWGNYVVGGPVSANWGGFADPMSGVAGYYLAWTNASGSTNGAWTVLTNGALAVAPMSFDATNHLYVWAKDNAGMIGSAANAAVLVLDPGTDFDHDGLVTADEQLAGTDAANPSSVLRFISAAAGPPAGSVKVVLSWPTSLGRQYDLHWRKSLAKGRWQPIPRYTNVPGTGGTLSYTDDVSTAETRFYRLDVHLP